MTDEFDWLTLDPDEELVWSGQPRIWRIWPTVAGTGVAVILTLVAASALAFGTPTFGLDFPTFSPLPVFGVAVLVLFALAGQVAHEYLRVAHTDYVLTTESVYVKQGILSETVTSMGVERVQNTTLRKSVTGNRFDYGTVALSSAGSGGADLAISDLNDPETFRDRLQERVRERAGSDESAGARPAVGAETLDALVSEARRLRETAERMEGRV